MPRFQTMTAPPKILNRMPSMEVLDEYVQFLKPLNEGDWGKIELDEGEDRRTVKRRTTLAAKILGKPLKWKAGKEGNALVFSLQEVKHRKKTLEEHSKDNNKK